jgi:D-alanine-D-alanine ligase
MPEPKIRLAVLFGGANAEHDVSCNSAASIIAHLDRKRYDLLPIRIGRDGRWAYAADVPDLADAKAARAWMTNGFPAAEGTSLSSILDTIGRLQPGDLVFPALHGAFGEDGTLQGLLEGFGISFVGNGVLASALSMDKEYTKKIAVSVGLTVADGVVLREGENDVAPADRDRLGLPVFVKPSREGSSVGVTKLTDWADLPEALAKARESDQKVLVESAVPGREVDIGVLERPGGIIDVSPPMEILTSDEHVFFDYEAKYDDTATVLDVPAKLDPAITERLSQDALTVFRALDCSGLLRVDFFVRPDGTVVLNEVNTFPGFTSASQYPRMWQAAGLSYSDLLDVMVETACWRAGQRLAPARA